MKVNQIHETVIALEGPMTLQELYEAITEVDAPADASVSVRLVHSPGGRIDHFTNEDRITVELVINHL